jgi:hypothetical protein
MCDLLTCMSFFCCALKYIVVGFFFKILLMKYWVGDEFCLFNFHSSSKWCNQHNNTSWVFQPVNKVTIFFPTTIVTTCSLDWLHSCKWCCDATWHYGFAIIVNITTWWFLHKYQNIKNNNNVFLIIQNQVITKFHWFLQLLVNNTNLWLCVADVATRMISNCNTSWLVTLTSMNFPSLICWRACW